jgi:hypothetical protein
MLLLNSGAGEDGVDGGWRCASAGAGLLLPDCVDGFHIFCESFHKAGLHLHRHSRCSV